MDRQRRPRPGERQIQYSGVIVQAAPDNIAVRGAAEGRAKEVLVGTRKEIFRTWRSISDRTSTRRYRGDPLRAVVIDRGSSTHAELLVLPRGARRGA